MKISPVLIAFAVLIPFYGSNANAATVIYREVFGVATSGTNYALSNAGWSAAMGSSATDFSTNVDTLNGAFISVGNSGNPQNVDNVNAGAPAASLQKGFVGVALSSSYQRLGLVYTTEYSFNPASFQSINFSWYEGNNTTTASMRVAVQIGGNWYVANTAFSNNPAVSGGANFATQSVMQSFDFTTSASQWSTLNFTPGSALVVGSTLTSALPTGTITGFGLYNSDTSSSSMRFDTFTISAVAVPEPGAFSMCFLGVGALLWVRRFRKTSRVHNI